MLPDHRRSSRPRRWLLAASIASPCRTLPVRTHPPARLPCRFPDLPERSIRAALGDGGDLNEVASRLLSGGGVAAAPAPALAMMSRDPLPPASLGGATLSGSAAESVISGAISISTDAADREVALATAREEMAAVGSARGALSPTGSRLVAAMEPYQASQVELGHMTLRQLGEGPLRLTARIARTVNELEESLIGGDKVVTQYVIEVRQLGFTWEVTRRYSQFATFNETLSFHWVRRPSHYTPLGRRLTPHLHPPHTRFTPLLIPLQVDLPELPPKRFFATECDDLAERMMQLERYLKVLHLLATPHNTLNSRCCTPAHTRIPS